MISNLTSLVSNFIIGVAALPAVVLIFYLSLSADPSLSDLQKVVDYLNAHERLEWVFVGATASVCVMTGILIDFVGFGLVDGKILRERLKRKNLLRGGGAGEMDADKLDALLKTLSPPADDFGLGVNLPSYFYSQAPPHVLTYHAEQWTYSMTCRNLAVAAFLYLVAGAVYFSRHGVWQEVVGWVAGAAIVVVLLLFLMLQGVRYYHTVEAVFVLGWLRAKLAFKDSTEVTLKTAATDATPDSAGGRSLVSAAESAAEAARASRGGDAAGSQTEEGDE